MALIIRWILNALALIAVAYLYPGVQVDGFFSALVAALVLGLVNAVIRPLLLLLTLPVNILTLGLFTFVINAACFWFVAQIIKGFTVRDFLAALIGSILYSLITLVISWLISGKKDK